MNEAPLFSSLSRKVLQLVTFDGVISDPSFIGVTECRIILGRGLKIFRQISATLGFHWSIHNFYLLIAIQIEALPKIKVLFHGKKRHRIVADILFLYNRKILNVSQHNYLPIGSGLTIN